MITIQIPNNYMAERYYILSVMFSEFLGLDIQVDQAVRENIRITVDGSRELFIADGLFTTLPEQWLQPASLPEQPIKVWDLAPTGLEVTTVRQQLPVVYGDDPARPDFFRISEEQIYLGLDIFGSTFFMLTRYEEFVKSERDQHERFPASASLAFQEGFLDRPIVNEYLEVLWAVLTRLWPSLTRRLRTFQFLVSHDVDWPLSPPDQRTTTMLKNIAADLLKRQELSLAKKRLHSHFASKTGNFAKDPNNTFDWLMRLSEGKGMKSAFYFICAHTAGRIDGVYSMDDPWIQKLIAEIHNRGHEIGLHPSYHTFRDSQQIYKEFNVLQRLTAKLGIRQEQWGGRQHYLRWETPTTWQAWADAGLSYDTTVGYADHSGFRTGTCYTFPVFNLTTRQRLKLQERPLIAMEVSLLEPQYMNLDHNQAWKEAAKLRQHCKMFEGDFTLLWHNSTLVAARDMDLYQKMIERF